MLNFDVLVPRLSTEELLFCCLRELACVARSRGGERSGVEANERGDPEDCESEFVMEYTIVIPGLGDSSKAIVGLSVDKMPSNRQWLSCRQVRDDSMSLVFHLKAR